MKKFSGHSQLKARKVIIQVLSSRKCKNKSASVIYVAASLYLGIAAEDSAYKASRYPSAAIPAQNQ
jgi:hypothetical protein